MKSQGQFNFPSLASSVQAQQDTIDLLVEAGDLPKRLSAKDEFDFRFDPVIQSALESRSVAQR